MSAHVRQARYATALCDRCGVIREVNRSRDRAPVCRDCRSVESREAMRELRRDASPLDAGGTWVRHGLILRWQPPAPKKRRVKRLSTPPACAQSLDEKAEQMFDQSNPSTTERGAA